MKGDGGEEDGEVDGGGCVGDFVTGILDPRQDQDCPSGSRNSRSYFLKGSLKESVASVLRTHSRCQHTP